MKEKQKPFRVFIRRESGYEPVLTVRFEVTDGHGILVMQKKGRRVEPSPALVQEERDITPKALRAGRFIHVLAGTGRRQSYALSRMGEDLLGRVPEDRWTELEPLTEYGFRYLTLDESTLEPPADAAPAAIAVPGNVRPAGGAPGVAVSARPIPADDAASSGGLAATARRSASLDSGPKGDGPSALQRAMAAIRSGRPGQDATDALRNTPRPAPTAKVTGGRTAALAAAAAGGNEVDVLRAHIKELERKLADSITREKDLLEILGRWQEREIQS